MFSTCYHTYIYIIMFLFFLFRYYTFDMQQKTLTGPNDAASKFIKNQCTL